MARADGLSPAAGRVDRPGAARSPALLLCALLSAGGHAALLVPAATWPVGGHTPAGRNSPTTARPGAGSPTRAASVEVLPAAAPLRSRSAPPGSPQPRPAADGTSLRSAGEAESAAAVNDRVAAVARHDVAGLETEVEDVADVADVAADAATPAPADDDVYLPRSALDQGPAPTGVVDLPYPADAPAGRFEGVLTLFIDAAGRVQRVRHDSGNLPAQLADEARQAFLAAAFSPGIKDGQAVGSRLRVAVTFRVDAPRIEPATPAASDPR